MKRILLVLLAAFAGLHSQSFEIISVDPAAYPRMKAQIVVKDATDQQIRSYAPGDLSITDGGKARPVIGTECLPNQTMFSVILTLDVTGSMNININALEADMNMTPPQRGQVAKATAKTFIQQLPDGRFEAAFTTFANDSYLLKDFTTNKQSIIDTLSKVGFNGPTNYNRGFLGNNNNGTGACDLADRAKYKPVVIFITDGAQDLNKGPIEVGKILPRLQAANATAYCISIGKEVASDAELTAIATATGGKYYKNISNEATIATIYQQILNDANNLGDPVPCTVEWMTDCSGGDLSMTYLAADPDLTASFQYVIPDAVKPHLDIVKRKSDLALNTPLNSTQEIPYTITSQKNTSVITDVISPDPRYKIDWKGNTPPVTLEAGQSLNIAVDYTPDTRVFSQAGLTVVSSACSGNDLTARGGYIFAEDIVFDQVDQGQTDTKDFTQRFCNYTDEDITVSNIKVTGGANQADFGIVPQLNVKVPAGECITIRASFSPKDQGDREADYTVTLDDGKAFTAKMRGGGSGRANISAAAAGVPEINCKQPEATFVISVTNSGPVPLNVTNVISDNPDFTITGSTAFIVGANQTDNTTLTVRFSRSAAGTSNADITIESDAENGDAFVELSGVREGVNYTVDRTEIDFGIICANSGNPLVQTIKLANLAGFDYSAGAQVKNGSAQFAVTETDDLISDKNGEFSVTFQSEANGIYTDVIEITDECGELVREVAVRGEINSPELVPSTHSVSATIGSFEDQTVTVQNSTQKIIAVTSAIVVDASNNPIPQFSVSVQNFQIPAGGTYDVIVRYTPANGDDETIVGTLKLSGTDPCGFILDNTEITGYPGLARATVDVHDYNTQYAGNNISIPVHVINKQSMSASGATRIVARIEASEELLQPLGGTAVSPGVQEYVFNLDGTDNDQDFAIDFYVKAGASVTQTTFAGISLSALNAASQDVAFIDYDEGIFEISPAAAELVLIGEDDFIGAPGDVIDFPIAILDESGSLQAVHNDVKVSVTLNSNVLVFNENTGLYNGSDNTSTYVYDRKMDFKGTAGGQYSAGSLKLKAVLGSRIEGDVRVEIIPVSSPFDIAPDTVSFKLDKLCMENNMTRLYSASETGAGLSIAPNPVTSDINIEFSNLEPGRHTIRLFNMEGLSVTDILDEVLPAEGSFRKSMPAVNLHNGVYFMIYETPTQKFVKSMVINR